MVQAHRTTNLDWTDTRTDHDHDVLDASRCDADDEFYELMSRRSAAMQSADVAEYAADLARELASLCRHARLDLVAYMLEAAADEAGQQQSATRQVAGRDLHRM
jgi:hypothetical protein